METLHPVCTKEELHEMQACIRAVYVHPALMEYMIELINRTRRNDNIALGVSPRGTLALLRASQAYAALQGLTYITPEIIKHLVPFVLTHRLILRSNFQKTASAAELLSRILEETAVPTENFTDK